MSILDYTPKYIESIQHPSATKTSKHGMTVEKYLELLEKQQGEKINYLNLFK